MREDQPGMGMEEEMDDSLTEDVGPDTPTFEGMEDEPKTALGFGGQTIHRRLHIGDELYLVIKAEISSEKESEDADGNRKFAAGCRTTVLAELSAADAAQVAAGR